MAKSKKQMTKEIISELEVALGVSGQDLLQEILKKYEVSSDEEIFKLLIQYNLEYENRDLEDEDNVHAKKMIIINEDHTFDIKYILSIKKERYARRNTGMGPTIYGYRLVINEDKLNKVMYSNTFIELVTEQQMDFEWGKAKRKLERLKVIFI